MHGNYGYFEEGKLGKPYDWPLWRRLASYARSYLKVIGLSCVLILLLTGFDLTLPYLLKVGIDKYILPSARQVRVPEAPAEPPLTRFLNQVRGKLNWGPEPGQFFITGQTLTEVDPRLLRWLEEKGIITEQRFYFTPIRSEAQRKIVLAHPSLFHSANGIAYVDYQDQAKLSAAEIVTLRRQDISGLYRLGFIFVFLLLLSAACTFGQNLLMVYAGQHMMHDLRMQLFSHLQKMSLSFFDRNRLRRKKRDSSRGRPSKQNREKPAR